MHAIESGSLDSASSVHQQIAHFRFKLRAPKSSYLLESCTYVSLLGLIEIGPYAQFQIWSGNIFETDSSSVRTSFLCHDMHFRGLPNHLPAYFVAVVTFCWLTHRYVLNIYVFRMRPLNDEAIYPW